jgi:hypothetical protein
MMRPATFPKKEAARQSGPRGEAPMFVAAVLLGSVSFVVLVTGFVWGLIERGQTRRAQGPGVGAEIMAEKMGRETATSGKTPLVQKTGFVGSGWAVEREAEYSWSEIRAAMRGGHIRTVLPALLVCAGMLGFLSCLSLALLLRMDNKIFGGVLLIMTVWGFYLAVRGLVKAS